MMQAFKWPGHTGVALSQRGVCMHPGKLYDRTDNDPQSFVPEGGPAPYGRVLVAGVSAGKGVLSTGYNTNTDSVALPDKDGEYLTNDLGETYADAGLSLPVDGDGLLIVRGVGVWTEHNALGQTPLAQPVGFGEQYYQSEKCGQVAVAKEGNIVCYNETDIAIGDKLFFRTVVTAATDGVQLLGAFSNAGGANFQPFTHGSVFVAGAAGKGFVLNLNTQG